MDVRKNLEEFIEGQTTKVRQKVADKLHERQSFADENNYMHCFEAL